jgi:hypothetical protein
MKKEFLELEYITGISVKTDEGVFLASSKYWKWEFRKIYSKRVQEGVNVI